MRRVLSRDVVGGALLCAVGVFFAYFGAGLAFGRPRAMGPGFFPIVVAGIVIVMGGVLIARGALTPPVAIERGRWRPLIATVGAMALFGALLEPLGVIVATVTCVAVAALAEARRNPVETAALAGGLALVCWLVFVRLLGQTIPVWPLDPS